MLFNETWTRYGPGDEPNAMDRPVANNEAFYHSRVPGVESVLISVTQAPNASINVAFNDYVVNIDPYQVDEDNNDVTVITYPNGSQKLMPPESPFVDYVVEGILVDPLSGDFSGTVTEVGYDLSCGSDGGFWGGGGRDDDEWANQH